jgi:hypothetical protein
MPIQVNPITSSAREGFRSVLALPDGSLNKIGRWARDHIEALISGDLSDDDIKPLAVQVGVGLQEISLALSLAMTVLMNSERSGDSLDLSAPQRLGIDDLDGKLQLLLAPIDIPYEELVKLRQNSFASRSIIPTLSDVDALCDLRAIFRSFPSGSPSERHRSGVKALLGFEPVVIVNLELNDASGNDRPAVFQVSEQGLRNLIKTLEESLVQIEIVKKELPRLSPKT